MQKTILNILIAAIITSPIAAHAVQENYSSGTFNIVGEAGSSYDLEAFNNETANNAASITQQSSDLLKANSAIKANTTQIDENKTNIAQVSGGLQSANDVIKANTTQIDENKTNIAQVSGGLQSANDAIKANTTQIDENKTNIAQIFGGLQTTRNAIKIDTDQIDQNKTNIAQVSGGLQSTRAAQQKTDVAVSRNSASIADHEQRIEALENGNSNFENLDKKIDENRKRASAGIAGVAAMANIPQVLNSQTFAVGAGVGTTDGESALAVGFSTRATEHVVVKASVSDDSQRDFVVGGGVAYGW